MLIFSILWFSWNIQNLLIRINNFRIVTFEWTQSFNQDRTILLNISLISLIYSCTFRVPCILRIITYRSRFLLHSQMDLLLFWNWFVIFTRRISVFLFINIRMQCIFVGMHSIIFFFIYNTVHVILYCDWRQLIWVWRGYWALIIHLQGLQMRYHNRW